MAGQQAQNEVLDQIERGWLEVKVGAIDKIHTFLKTGDSQVVFSKKEYMAYYSLVYKLCTLKYSHSQQILYGKYTESIREYLEQNVKRDLEPLSGTTLLTQLCKKWADHVIMVKWMRAFFQYLDRFYVDINSATKLSDQGFKIFKEVVFKPLCNNTTQAVVEEIYKQRNGDQGTNIELLQKTVTIYLTLSQGKLGQDGFIPRVALD